MKSPALLASAAMLAICPCAHAATTLTFDFGSGATPTTGINNFTGTGSINNPIIDASGGMTLTGVSLALSGIAGSNTNGTQSPTGDLALFAANTTRDSIYGDNTNSTITLAITGLNPATLYSFEFGNSRTSVSDNRSTDFNVAGLNNVTFSTTLNPSNNTSNTANITNISPTAGGNITITMNKTAGVNDNTTGWYYINGMQMTVVPEPSAALLGALGALALLRRRR